MTAASYAYDHVSPDILSEDMAFREGAPAAGDRLPEIDLPTVDGGRFRAAELIGHRPMLLVTGSLTCQMTASSNPLLKRLWSEFGSAIEFVTLYVREAHPGDAP